MTLTVEQAHEIANKSQRVLLLLDVQQAMLHDPPEGVPAAKKVKENISFILEKARQAVPPPLIVHVRNTGDAGDMDEPHTLGWELIFPVEPTELVIDKRKNNAFAGTSLGDIIDPESMEIIVVGFQTDYSIKATCNEALKRGAEVVMIRGSHATHDRIEVLHGGGITPAGRIMAEVEHELEDAGVHLLEMKDVPALFTGR